MKRIVCLLLIAGLVIGGIGIPSARAASFVGVHTGGIVQANTILTEFYANDTGVHWDGNYIDSSGFWGGANITNLHVEGWIDGVAFEPQIDFYPTGSADPVLNMRARFTHHNDASEYQWHMSGTFHGESLSWESGITAYDSTVNDGIYTEYIPLSVTVTGDSTPYVDVSANYSQAVTGGTTPQYGYWEVFDGASLEYGGSQVSIATDLSYTFTDVGTHDVVFTCTDSANNTAHGHFWAEAYVDPLEVTLGGLTAVAVNIPVSYSGTGSHGVPGYQYRFGVAPGGGPVGSWSAWQSSTTWSYTYTVNGTFSVQAQARDSHNEIASSNVLRVYVGDVADSAGFRWQMCRRGVNGEYVDIQLFEMVGGAETPLLGSAWSTSLLEIAYMNADGVMAHDLGISDIGVSAGGGGRTIDLRLGIFKMVPASLVLSLTATHGGVDIPIVADLPGVQMCASGWNQEDGTAINPVEFPEETATGLDWLKPVIDALMKLFNALFVPTEAQMRTLMPSGTLGASLLEGTSWGSAGSTWELHVHWGVHEIVLVNLTFADYASNGFVVAIRTAVQIGYLLAMVYMVVVLL
jgi:hypothetical protein